MSNRASMGHVYDQLQYDGYIDADEPPYSPETDETPWYIQALLGGGGWVAAFFLLGTVGFCISTIFLTFDETAFGLMLMLVGAIFASIPVILTRIRKSDGFFISQLLLTFHLAGQLAVIGGMVMAFALWISEATTVTALVIVIIMQILFIGLYPNVIYRFLAMLFIAMCLAAIATILEAPLIISLSIGILLLFASMIWLDRFPVRWQIHHSRLLLPVGYGAIIGALGLLTYESGNRGFWYDAPDTILVTGSILAISLLWVIVTLLRDYDMPLSSRFAIAVLIFAIILSVIVVGTPGILAGLIIVVMSFRRRNLILQGIGYAFFAGFIIYYYYLLDVTLLMKSVILIVSGVLLLAGRFGLNRFITVSGAKKGVSE